MKQVTREEFLQSIGPIDAVVSAHPYEKSTRMYSLFKTRSGRILGRINEAESVVDRALGRNSEYFLADKL